MRVRTHVELLLGKNRSDSDDRAVSCDLIVNKERASERETGEEEEEEEEEE
jgi:hypothetical protein